ncbi:MAG: MBL fold metallo-hydrolase [Acidobacteriota bacterium]|nr:MBL fold metallo-hydrolase [Acidobacteriota bacterium]MDQ5871219.1 MBL fold metallo-hydrolase [Acidobacteriota bacterium]
MSSAAPLVRTIRVGPLQCNCSIVADLEAGEAVVVDPGDEADRILLALAETKCRAIALLHTHGHFDHIGGTAGVKLATGAAIRIHDADRPLYDALPDQASFFGLSAQPTIPPDAGFEDGETIAVGRFQLRAIHTPGHTPGSTCFLLGGLIAAGAGRDLTPFGDQTPLLFSGDTLFRRSIGRTDLWGGDTETILASIREKLLPLPADLRVVCGHGPDTTIGEERRENPFVGESS